VGSRTEARGTRVRFTRALRSKAVSNRRDFDQSQHEPAWRSRRVPGGARGSRAFAGFHPWRAPRARSESGSHRLCPGFLRFTPALHSKAAPNRSGAHPRALRVRFTPALHSKAAPNRRHFAQSQPEPDSRPRRRPPWRRSPRAFADFHPWRAPRARSDSGSHRLCPGHAGFAQQSRPQPDPFRPKPARTGLAVSSRARWRPELTSARRFSPAAILSSPAGLRFTPALLHLPPVHTGSAQQSRPQPEWAP
jgi:hypothetical protein